MNDRVELPPAVEVCPTTTRRKIAAGALLVDVRERAEIDQIAFDVPDLVVMPMSEFERRWAELPRERDIVLVCQVGVRSLKATYFLIYHGYTRVANMSGGLAKWIRKGFPVKGDIAQALNATAASCCCASGPASTDATSDCCAPPETSTKSCC
jgi:rhodanese-related sulfurtransferase